ncbi:hypothetical protein E2C01_089586 [Portunus trituberculatus]|uniref:Uncharacterized protein n=1 Tax=Portunus trituberculatus TaxID=210409 RepID=A0A5B7JMT2_PORTR|nr:hypothetical protein [Portunus trituberculatus]
MLTDFTASLPLPRRCVALVSVARLFVLCVQYFSGVLMLYNIANFVHGEVRRDKAEEGVGSGSAIQCLQRPVFLE